MQRIFKIGSTQIVEDESMQGLFYVTWNMMR
jgi:hypothetical protein